MSKKLKITIVVVIGLLLMTATFVFYTFDPSQKAIFLQCPFLLTTGYECPGCGSQRAIHSLLHLKIRDAFNHNALILFFIPYILLGIFMELRSNKKRAKKIERIFFGQSSAVILIVIILAYWILRNINF